MHLQKVHTDQDGFKLSAFGKFTACQMTTIPYELVNSVTNGFYGSIIL